MTSLRLFLALLSLIFMINCQKYSGSITVIENNSITITIDYDTNIVNLILSGASNAWNGFGFGSTIMSGTYAIIMEYNRNDLSQSQLWEFTLGNRKPGFRIIKPEITVISDIDNGAIRTVTITRPIIGIEYTFPNPPLITNAPFVIDLISAIGPQPSDYVTSSAHLFRATAPITLTRITTATPTVNPISTATSNPTSNPISTATLNPTSNPSLRPSLNPTANPIDNREVIQCIDAVCSGKEVQCTQNKSCLIQCNSEKACFNTTITCHPATNCTVEGVFAYSLTKANIIGPIGYNLDISCDNLFSCQGIKIDASQTSTVNLKCPGMKSCENIEIYCPPHNADGTKNCIITGNTVDSNVDTFSEQTSMVIHAINSWNDIDLTGYLPTIGTSNSMFCGVNFVEDVCTIGVINGIWNCMETNSLCFVVDSNITTTPSITTTTTTNKPLTTQTLATNYCLNGDILTSSTNTGIFNIIATINCSQNTIIMNITYNSYVNNWFGFVFNTEMFGDALVFTTGKENINRNAALYAYDLNGRTSADVIYNAANDWIEISKTVDTSNGIQIVYQQNLLNTKWNGNTNNIQFREAIGSSLTLEKHIITSGVFSLNFTALIPTTTVVPTTLSPITATPTTAIPTSIPSTTPTVVPVTAAPITSTTTTAPITSTTTTATTIEPIITTSQSPTDAPSVQPTSTTSQVPTDSVECPYGDILSASSDADQELLVMITLNCKEEVIYIDITYPGFNDNWFGLVFNNEMNGDSVIYTTGKIEDNLSNNNGRLYAYDLNGRSIDAVIYNPGKDWSEISTVINNGIQVQYQQELRKTQWNKNTNMIQFRSATGRALRLQQHIFRSEETYILNLTATDGQTTTTTVPDTTTIIPDQSVIVCDENSNCSDTDIICTVDNMVNSNGSCVVKCVSDEACYRTHVICLDGYDCYLYCMGDESCKQAQIQCGNDSNCYIKGDGKRALYRMDINGQIQGGEMQIECNGENACNSTLIAGRDADKLEIICAAKQSCQDIQIQCPQFTETANCKILATSDESVGDVIDIFAINSWRDIDNSSYLPSGTMIEMFCGAMYGDECVGVTNNEEWNCMDKISNCWMDVEETLIIKCSEDRVCNDITISCDKSNPFAIDNSIPDGGCRIICDGRGSCSGSDIACSINKDNPKCEIICNGDGSCSDIERIDCGTSNQCDIECIGAKSCSNVNINCGANGEAVRCDINGRDDESLLNAQIDCLENTNCNIDCAAMDTCKDIVIYGIDSDFINITCNNTSCNDMELYCPSTEGIVAGEKKKCVISGQGDEHNEFTIYAQNSWNDIDLIDYTATIIPFASKTNISSIMYCGTNYTDYCIMRDPEDTNNWNCIDDKSVCYVPIIPITTTTTSTTIETTIATIDSTDTATICNGRECAGKTLECPDDVREECTFNCMSPNACNGTTFNCKDETLCRITCESVGACNGAIINCGNNGNCFVDGNAENALSNAIINGGTDITELEECALNIGCNALSSCLKVTINGQQVDQLNIVCTQLDSCKDVIIHCPEYTEIHGNITKHCIINGNIADDSITIHDEFIIYAKNSWDDIEFKHYLPIIQTVKSKMYCGDDLTQFCVINNPFIQKEWNCDDKESVCYIGEIVNVNTTLTNNLTEIRCHEVESPCNDITDLKCSNPIGCKFVCDTRASCDGLNIYCLDTSKCEVECNGESSCKGVNIYGDSKDTEINVICNGEISCEEATFHAEDSSDLKIECIGYSGCDNMKITCPVTVDNVKHCRIIGGNNDVHYGLEFYAINGFDDVDIANYSGDIINSTMDGMDDNNNLNIMHCGNNYQFSCQLNSSLLCDCTIDQKQIEFGNQIGITTPLLIGIIVACCAVFVIVLITAIYCLYYKPRHPKEYSSVNEKQPQNDTIPIEDDPDDNDAEAIQLNATKKKAYYEEL